MCTWRECEFSSIYSTVTKIFFILEANFGEHFKHECKLDRMAHRLICLQNYVKKTSIAYEYEMQTLPSHIITRVHDTSHQVRALLPKENLRRTWSTPRLNN